MKLSHFNFRAKAFFTAALLAVFSSASYAATPVWYSFTQTGFSGGGVITGSFTGTDLNGDGFIIMFPGQNNEVTNFTYSFTGDSIIGDFTSTSLWGLIYRAGTPYLGDDRIGMSEGVATNLFNGDDGSHLGWISGQGPVGQNGGYVRYSYGGEFLTSSTHNLISITPDVTPVPEPSTYGLMGAAGLLGLGFLRRRSRKA